MAEYIEREAIIAAIVESKNDNPHTNGTMRVMHDHEHMRLLRITAMQPAADVAPVVRCKDCENAQNECDGMIICRVYKHIMWLHDFCSYGKRKDEGEANA